MTDRVNEIRELNVMLFIFLLCDVSFIRNVKNNQCVY